FSCARTPPSAAFVSMLAMVMASTSRRKAVMSAFDTSPNSPAATRRTKASKSGVEFMDTSQYFSSSSSTMADLLHAVVRVMVTPAGRAVPARRRGSVVGPLGGGRGKDNGLPSRNFVEAGPFRLGDLRASPLGGFSRPCLLGERAV